MSDFVKTNVWMLFISRFFERFGYYGIRSIILIYAMSSVFSFQTESIFEFYGYLTISVGVFGILGALLGDLIQKNGLIMFIGSALQLLGMLVISIPNQYLLVFGMGVLALGTGLYTPNSLAQLGKSFLQKNSKIDFAYGLNYLIVNIGAFIGIILVGYLSEWSFYLGLFCVIFSFSISLLMNGFYTFTTNFKLQETKHKTNLNIPVSIILIVVSVFFTSMFWLFYEIYSTESLTYTFDLFANLENNNSSVNYKLSSNINFLTILLFGGALCALWFFVKISSLLKYTIGFIIAAITMILFYFSFVVNKDSGLSMFILLSVFLTLGEFLIAVSSLSLLSKNINPRYLALIVSALSFLTLSLTKLVHFINDIIDYIFGNNLYTVLIIGICMLVLAMVSIIIFIVFKLVINSKYSKQL